MPFEQIPDDYVAQVPNLGADGLSSARVQFDKTLVPAKGSPKFPYGAMNEFVYPLAAISTSHPLKRTKCGPGSVFMNDGLTRVAVTVSGISLVDNSVTPSNNWQLVVQVRASNGFVSMGMAQYRFPFVPGTFPPGQVGQEVGYRSGLVAQYGGPLCTQFEVWGVVDSLDPIGDPGVDIRLSMTLHVDRIGTPEQSIIAPLVVDDGKTLIFPTYY